MQDNKAPELFAQVVAACRYLLMYDPIGQGAQEYLNSRFDPSSQYKFQFGYFPTNEQIYKLTDLVDEDILEQLGLRYNKYESGAIVKHNHFHYHNLICPFNDEYGNIISLLGRTSLSNEERKKLQIQKYKYSYGTPKELYLFGLDKAKKYIIDKNYVICVEGQYDAITCHSRGVRNVVALGGCSLTKFHFYNLNKYTNNIYILLDNDEAGEKGKNKIKNRYKEYANVRGLSLGKMIYKDIDDCLRKDSRANDVVNWLNSL